MHKNKKLFESPKTCREDTRVVFQPKIKKVIHFFLQCYNIVNKFFQLTIFTKNNFWQVFITVMWKKVINMFVNTKEKKEILFKM